MKYTEYMCKFGLTEEPLLKGLEFAKEVYLKAMSKGVDKIVLKGDPDVDGYLALYVAMELFKGIKGDYKLLINPDRAHGMVDGEKYKNVLFINLDSGITEQELIDLVEVGNYVISLDHHDLEYNNEGSTHLIMHEYNGYSGVILNNQYLDFPDDYRFWSGTGVTLQGLCYILGKEPTEELIACHGISLLSDVRDIENPWARELLEFTFNLDLKKCPLLLRLTSLVTVNEDSRYREVPDKLDRNFVDYKLSPYINAGFQLNKGAYLVKFLVTKKVDYFLDFRGLRKHILGVLEDRVQVKELPNLTVLMLDDIEPVDLSEVVTPKGVKFKYSLTNFVGLYANRFLNKGKTVMIVAKDGDKWVRGSVRGVYSSVDYKALFKEAGFLAEGHSGAFGLLGLVRNSIDFARLDKRISEMESLDKSKQPLVVIENLLDSLDELKNLAYENQFKLSKNFVKVIYTGISKKYIRGNTKYAEYEVDGLSVLTFTPEIDLDSCYLEPVWVLGRLEIYAKPRIKNK